MITDPTPTAIPAPERANSPIESREERKARFRAALDRFLALPSPVVEVARDFHEEPPCRKL